MRKKRFFICAIVLIAIISTALAIKPWSALTGLHGEPEISEAEPIPAAEEIKPDPLEGTLLLVNINHPLPEDYYPEDLVTIYGNLPDRPFLLARADLALRGQALDAFVKMLSDAEAAGKKNYLLLSGFRDFAKQASLFDESEPHGEYLGTQPPGASEHQTGLAADFCKQSVDMRGFLDTSEGAWVIKNAPAYGFILRFPEDKSALTGVIYEPWHYRYVGLPHSLIIASKGWCLEEYIDWIRSAGCVRVVTEQEEYEIKSVLSEAVPVAPGAVVSGDNLGGFIVTTRIK